MARSHAGIIHAYGYTPLCKRVILMYPINYIFQIYFRKQDPL